VTVNTLGKHLKMFSSPCEEPMVCLFVSDESINFLVDTGAAMSVINSKSMSKPPMSNESVTAVGASGVTMKELLTMPLPVKVDNVKLFILHVVL
jgi:predicted aspartyl protease